MTNAQIRDKIERLLTASGFSVCDGGYGFWKITTPSGKVRVVSLRIKADATLHRKTQTLEYGIDRQDWERLHQIDPTIKTAVFVYDKKENVLSWSPLSALYGRVRGYEEGKIDPVIFIPQNLLKPIATLP